MNKKLSVLISFGVLILVTLACRAPTRGENLNDETNIENQETDMADNQEQDQLEENVFDDSSKLDDTELGRLLNSGAVSLESINANSSDDDTFGQILTLQLTNPGTEEVVFSFPCGLVFIPSDNHNQRLMLVQPLEINLVPGETQSPTPYVVCIDVAASAPAYDNSYSLGYVTDNELLLKFAECICNKDISTGLGSMDGVGIQFAAWSIGMAGDFSQTLANNPEMEEYFSQEYGDNIEAGIEELMGMITMFGDSWLEDCGIDIEK